MRLSLTTAISVATLLSLSACHIEIFAPEAGNSVATTRPLPVFSKLSVSDGIETVLQKGPAESVRIETREGYLSYFITEVVDGVLYVRLSNRFRLSNVRNKRVVITLQTLSGLTTSGGVRLTSSDDFQPQRLNLTVSGGGYVSMPLTADALSLSGSGGSEIQLTGAAGTVNVSQLSGGSTLRLANLSATTCTMDASGGSVAEVNVSQTLTVTASGGSRIRYRGQPTLIQHLSGGSTVLPL